MTENETITTLKKAVQFSPDNVPLREHLGDSLMSLGRYEEAADEFTSALAMAKDSDKLKLRLAGAFYYSGKYTQSLVIVEDLIKRKPEMAEGHLLYARLLLNDGSLAKARDEYRQAVQSDPSLTDKSLEERLETTDKVMAMGAGEGMAFAARGGDDSPGKSSSAKRNDDLIDEDLDGPYNKAERPSITFNDIGGMHAVKEQIRMKIIYPLTNASMFAAYGKKIGGGILMYGPPGCGKTHLARATAGEIKAAFLSVGIADVLDMWIGSSEKNLHELFEQARRIKPCVLFFDEVDALAASRSDMRTSNTRQIINQFLVEMDGIEDNNDGVLILGATNAPWHLDSAFRRPGRFDRIIFVPPPDAPARAEIFRIVLKNKPVDKIDFDLLSKKSEKFSGADIQNAVDVAIEKKLEQAMKTGTPTPLNTKDLENAVKSVKPSTLEWLAAAKNYATYSNQAGIYDDVLAYLKMS
jgi:AAA+ superfamily predicted ATPase/predicted negative regulator of RcsB-dependent stress response